MARASLSRHTSVCLGVVSDVFAWVSRPDVVRPRALPWSEALDLVSVLSPTPELIAIAGVLAAAHAARLGLRAPPLGQTTPFGLSPFLLALGIGLIDRPELMCSILSHIAKPSGAWDLVLRDALVGRAFLQHEFGDDVLDMLRQHSPLSAVLERPVPGAEDEAMMQIDRLAASSDGRRMVILAFARPTTSPLVWRFRASVMDRLRLRERGPAGLEFVLEVYEAALVFYGDRTRAELLGAQTEICRKQPNPKPLELALSFAGYWGPLSRIRRASPEALRSMVYLELDVVLEACRLHRLAERFSGECT